MRDGALQDLFSLVEDVSFFREDLISVLNDVQASVLSISVLS